MRTRKSEKTFPPVKARSLLYLPAACLMLYAVHAYGETKSVTVTFGSHAYQTFKTTQAGENHTLNITKATTAPNIARSLIAAQDTQDQVLWTPAQITTAGSTHTYTMSGAALDEPLWVEIEGEFVKAGGGGGGAGAQKPDFVVSVLKVEIKKPTGDPSLPAGAGGANQWNERTYDAAKTGEVTVVCEAEDTPNADKLRWTIAQAGEIQATWEPHVDGNTYIGKGLNPTATFSGLPAQHTGFGSKTITLTMDEPGITANETQEVEIFFARDASNHSFLDQNDPKQVGPNWYYYSLQILQCVADNWGYIGDAGISPAWKPMYNYAQGWIVFTPDRCPGNPFYYIAHENKHHTDFFQEIWEGTGYNSDEDEGDEDGIRDDFEIDHYGDLAQSFDYIMQEDWSEPRANAAGNAASGDTSKWNKYWCDPGTQKGYQP